MAVAVGIDVGKEFHWAAVDTLTGELLLSRRVEDEPAAIAVLIEELDELRSAGAARIGIDVVGGIASLVVAMLDEAGVDLVHVPCGCCAAT